MFCSVINNGAPEIITPLTSVRLVSSKSKIGIVVKSQNSSTIDSIKGVLLLPQSKIKIIGLFFQFLDG